MHKINHISMKLAKDMSGYPCSVLFYRFKKEAVKGSVALWTHNRMLYHWLKNGVYGVHHIEPVCKVCGKESPRNFAGYGSMYIMHNGAGKHMTILCHEHAGNLPEWDWYMGHKKKAAGQLPQQLHIVFPEPGNR